MVVGFPARPHEMEYRMKIAFLGLGRMGRILAHHIVDAGHDVTVWNRSPERADEFIAVGALVASSPADAVAGVDVVITAFFGPDTVRDVVIEPGLTFDGVWVDITTISPADADEFALWAKQRGIAYVHSPVVGSLMPARNRVLKVLAGGAEEHRDLVRDVVALWADGGRVREFDTAAGAAGGKLIANLALATAAQGMVEALRLGQSVGFTNEQVVDMLSDTVLAPIAAMKGPMTLSEGFVDTQFSTNLLFKDVALMIASGDRPMPALTAVFESLGTAKELGFGEQDFSAILRGHCDS